MRCKATQARPAPRSRTLSERGSIRGTIHGADRVRPVWPVRISWLEWLGERTAPIFRRIDAFFNRFHFRANGGASVAGNWIGTFLLLAALVAFFFCVFMLWVRRDPMAGRGESERARPGTAARLGDLPEGIRPEDRRPLGRGEAKASGGGPGRGGRLSVRASVAQPRSNGLDPARAGRTGRHYLQSLRDRELIDSLGATLGLFEDVYYGRRRPTAQAFESVWNRAEAFQERQRTLGARVSP